MLLCVTTCCCWRCCEVCVFVPRGERRRRNGSRRRRGCYVDRPRRAWRRVGPGINLVPRGASGSRRSARGHQTGRGGVANAMEYVRSDLFVIHLSFDLYKKSRITFVRLQVLLSSQPARAQRLKTSPAVRRRTATPALSAPRRRVRPTKRAHRLRPNAPRAPPRTNRPSRRSQRCRREAGSAAGRSSSPRSLPRRRTSRPPSRPSTSRP